MDPLWLLLIVPGSVVVGFMVATFWWGSRVLDAVWSRCERCQSINHPHNLLRSGISRRCTTTRYS